MTDFILALASVYGVSGSAFKVFKPILLRWNLVKTRKHYGGLGEPDYELTNMLVDVFAFTLISIGFLVALLDVLPKNAFTSLIAVDFGLVQILFVLVYGSLIPYVDINGNTGVSSKWEQIVVWFHSFNHY